MFNHRAKSVVSRTVAMATACGGLVAVSLPGAPVEAAPDVIPFELVADVHTGGAPTRVNDFATFGSMTYFSADDGIHGIELWGYDSATDKTELIADVRPGPDGSFPRALAGVDDAVFSRPSSPRQAPSSG